jgi:hypothetical protein
LTAVNAIEAALVELCPMNKCVETMMQEHELIVEVLASLPRASMWPNSGNSGVA